MSEFVYLSTFNQFDWDCFAGALPLPDKSGPFIGEVSDWTVIVSGTEAGTVTEGLYCIKSAERSLDRAARIYYNQIEKGK
jgi:hypothetical protein